MTANSGRKMGYSYLTCQKAAKVYKIKIAFRNNINLKLEICFLQYLLLMD
jgi:hypothetical protein